ncbi:MAG: 8-oxo-dGTP diphosphatase MutT, partial [Clostridia bacterium]|nr:8-oxo-dGTP diphosphatase MutT [Clostridia bacterium]
RECREELDVAVRVDRLYTDVVHIYPDLTVHLSLFHAAIAEGTPQKLEHNDIRFITPAEIPEYDFCPADVEILEKIRQDFEPIRA